MRGLKSVLAFSSVMLLLIASTAYAGPWGGGCCAGGPGGGSWAARGGNFWNALAPDQKKEALSLRTDFLKKIASLRADLSQKRIEMLELAQKDKPDEAAIQKKREEIWSLQDKMRNERRAFFTKMRSLIPANQQNKLGPYGPGFCPGGGPCRGLGGGSYGGCPLGGRAPVL
jgi:Spy/CpxP family protein refolding chaperone